MYRSSSILPTYPPTQAFNGMGEYFQANSLGEYFTPTSGLGAFTQAAAGITGLGTFCPNGCGLGQPELDAGASMDSSVVAGRAVIGALAIGVFGLWIYMGYKIGEDLSPHGRNWGVGGAAMSLLGPFAHWGYGIMAMSNGRNGIRS